MAYSKDIYESAINLLNERRTRETASSNERKRSFYSLYPEASQIQNELNSTAINAARAVLKKANTAEELNKLKEVNIELQKRFKDLLKQASLSEDYLEPHFECSYCADTGFIDGKMCTCLEKLLRMEAYRKLNEITPLALSTFEDFSLEFYSNEISENRIVPRKQMEDIFIYCKGYANNFSLKAPNLLLQGGTGLGKTHLSLSIAKAAIDKGFGVIYGSSQNIASSLERDRFKREGNFDETNHLLLSCDLLILDDFGTEFSTSFTDAAIYNIINTRLMVRHPTIISTNLFILEMQKRYSERFISRIIGSYARLTFLGKDVRQQKQQIY